MSKAQELAGAMEKAWRDHEFQSSPLYPVMAAAICDTLGITREISGEVERAAGAEQPDCDCPSCVECRRIRHAADALTTLLEVAGR